MQVELFKKYRKYKDETETERTAVDLFVLCHETLIPIDAKMFKNKDGKDPNFSAKRKVLSTFANLLPDDKVSDVPTDNPTDK